MRQVPTAEEFLTEKGYPGFAKHTLIKEWMKEFAKLHVEAALKAAVDNYELNDFDASGEYAPDIDEESILNSYPLENIK